MRILTSIYACLRKKKRKTEKKTLENTISNKALALDIENNNLEENVHSLIRHVD